MNDTCSSINIDGHDIELSHCDKLLFPDNGISKGDLIDYYRRIAPVMLPHIENRPLSMQRFPDGINAEGFFQKDVPDYFPDWIERAELAKQDGSVSYCLGNNAATLVYLANQGCITPHVGLSCVDKVAYPDRLIFDLDPSDDDFSKVRHAALQIKALLDKLELAAFVQTTGSRGLHVVVPLKRSTAFDDAREFAATLAQRLVQQQPQQLTVEQRKNKRGDRVFIDYLRNAYGQTTVAPYSVRAKAGAPVATPLEWSEVNASDLSPRKYTLKNIFRRLGRKQDPWADLAQSAGSLDKARPALDKL
jgi:bifunctional non-homologous end joining protein LigD